MKIHIQLDQGWQFAIQSLDCDPDRSSEDKHMLEVDQAFIEEYCEACDRYDKLKDQVEQLYRVQQGLKPWATPAVPPHEIIEE